MSSNARPLRRRVALLTATVVLLAGVVPAFAGAGGAGTAGGHDGRTPPGHERRPGANEQGPPPHAPAHGRNGEGTDPGGDDDTGAQAGPPADFIALADQLSQPEFPEIVTEEHRVAMHDGVELYVEVTRPDPAEHGEGPWPVIMEASPYHGTLADRQGIRIFPDAKDDDGNFIGMTGYFAPRGYAVAMVGLRGTGRSGGCLDHLGEDDAKDLKTIVEWAADAAWSTGEVGMTGHSYVGSTPSVAAAQNPRGLVTIAPSAGLASMYDHQYQYGVPWFLQLAGPQYAYPLISTTRHLPPGIPTPFGPTGDDFGNNIDRTGCGWQNSAVTAGPGQALGRYEGWHAERDHREGATVADIPVFMIHGVNDNAARIPAAEWFFGERFDRPDDKVWVGQWDHGSAGATTCSEGHVNCRFDQWKYALHAWFDRHLQHREVDTGPSVEAFLNSGEVATASSWTEPAAHLELHPDADELTLGDAPGAEDSADFTAYAIDTRPVNLPPQGGEIEFRGQPFTEDAVLLGLPEMQLSVAQGTSQALNLIATLEREDTEGNRHPVTYCAIQTLLREGVETLTPVTPGARMDLDPQCFTVAHHVREGERLVLKVGTVSPHHVSTFTEDLRVTVFTGEGATSLAIPVVADAEVYPDVPLLEPATGGDGDTAVGPAQDTVRGTVTATAPAVGVRVPGATSVFFEFDVTTDTNARLEALASFGLPGDYDLYLQRQDAEGNWSGDLAAGETGSLVDEELTYARPAPGRYRLEVHNWSGPPGNPIDVVITFFDAAGEPGADPEG